MRARATILLLASLAATALDNGAAPTPPRGVTTWELLNFNVSDAKLRALADDIVETGLLAAGFDILWLDDGWPACAVYEGAAGVSACRTPAPRDAADGRIVPDAAKFPAGLAATIAYIHARGLRAGIYTAPHGVTCGGYTASLGHEATDANAFAAWGVDAVKLDAGCREDTSLRNGTLLASLHRMRDALNATGRRVVVYVDDGNPTSGPKVVNPRARGWPVNAFTDTHIARSWPELVVSWGPATANMYKLWVDRVDAFGSLLDNVHQHVHMAWFQSCGAFLAPDQMTVGQGAMSAGEERAEVFLYAALAAPMFLSAAPRALSAAQLALVTNPELLAVNADADCTMASQVAAVTADDLLRGSERWAFDVWAKPMSDASVVFVAVNKDPAAPRRLAIAFGDGGDGSSTDLFPAGGGTRARVRDLFARADLGTFDGAWTATVPPHDAVIVRVSAAARV